MFLKNMIFFFTNKTHLIDFPEIKKIYDKAIFADAIHLSDEEFSELISQFTSSLYLAINQMSDSEYCIHAKTRVLGGGLFGGMAGAYGGKLITHFVCHGAILIAAACTGRAAPATLVALEATFLPSIEAASTVVALAGCIAGSVATGPV